MRYWDDMQCSYGFGDGDSVVPAEADACREVYVKTINKLAELLGSAYRVAAYDRPGVHNYCLIRYVTSSHSDSDGVDEFVDEADSAMSAAVELARTFDLDSFIQVSVAITSDFEHWLSDSLPQLIA